jgi:Transposase IS116/IS110/IS902 family
VLLLTTIPGVNDLGAQVIRAEIGGDMTRFPSEAHLISWVGLCPQNDESAGKRRSNRMRLTHADGSFLTLRWREMDSNPRSPVRRTTLFETPLSQHARAPPPPSKTLAAPSSGCFFQL